MILYYIKEPMLTKRLLLSSGADVDVLQVDAASITSSVEDQKQYGSSTPKAGLPHSGRAAVGSRKTSLKSMNGPSRGGAATPSAGEDLRNYAYEGEGSSPGSLSSCE